MLVNPFAGFAQALNQVLDVKNHWGLGLYGRFQGRIKALMLGFALLLINLKQAHGYGPIQAADLKQ